MWRRYTVQLGDLPDATDSFRGPDVNGRALLTRYHTRTKRITGKNKERHTNQKPVGKLGTGLTPTSSFDETSSGREKRKPTSREESTKILGNDCLDHRLWRSR